MGGGVLVVEVFLGGEKKVEGGTLTCLSGDVGGRAELGRGRRRPRGQVLRAAAQPLLLLAQGHHLGPQLLVGRPAHEPAVHVLGPAVGLDLLPGVGGWVERSFVKLKPFMKMYYSLHVNAVI